MPVPTSILALKMLSEHCTIPFSELDKAVQIRSFLSSIASGNIVCVTAKQAKELAARAQEEAARAQEEVKGGDCNDTDKRPTDQGNGAGADPGSGAGKRVASSSTTPAKSSRKSS